MSDNILYLTEQTFPSIVERDPAPILVDFWAEWCMPCRALSPVIEELAREFAGKVRFAKVNADEARDLAAKLGIRGIPTLLLFQHGKKVGELVGNQPKDKIRALLAGLTS